MWSPSPRGSRGHPRQQPQTERGSSSRAKRQENLRWAADLSLSEGDAPAHWQEQITHLQKQLNFSTTMCQTLLQDQQVSKCTKLGMHPYISQWLGSANCLKTANDLARLGIFILTV